MPTFQDITLDATGSVVGGDSVWRSNDLTGQLGGDVENTTYTPTHYVTATASGSDNGTSPSTPWTAAQAMANASAGNIVRFAPGTYSATASNNRWLPAHRAANNGTAGNPIVFYAQYPAALNQGQTSLYTSMTHDESGTGGSPTIGGSGEGVDDEYITWDGMYIDEANAEFEPDSGPIVVNHCRNVIIKNCFVDGNTPAFLTASNNHCGIRLEDAIDCEVANNYITNIKTAPNPHHNGAAIMVYAYNRDSTGCNIHNNHIHDCHAGIYLKGEQDIYTIDDWDIHKNKITDCYFAIEAGSATGVTGSRIYQNLVIGDGTTCEYGIQIGRSFASLLTIANNTIAKCQKGIEFFDGGTHSANTDTVNNIVYDPQTAGSPLFINMGADGDTVTAAMAGLDDNCYYDPQSTAQWHKGPTNYSSLSTWQAALGTCPVGDADCDSINSDPLFTDAANEDYTLTGSSPCLAANQSATDILNLQGGGTGASIDMGCYAAGATVGLAAL